MPNPYLPSDFDENDFSLTHFQPDMVLTHQQLNTLFGYLMQQDAQTRTNLIGVGVVCGLEVSHTTISVPSIKVTKGCGVTTEGDFINFKEDKNYFSYGDYVLSEHAPYQHFQNINGLKLWELFTETSTGNIDKQPLNLQFIADKVVMLYLESQLKAADRCSGVDCDNQGDKLQNKLRILLVSKTDAEKLIEKSHRQAALACTKLPRAKSPRVRIDTRPYDISFRDFKIFLSNVSKDFSGILSYSFNEIDEVLKDYSINLSTIESWKSIIKDKTDKNFKDANIQYVYDWFKDLYDAYSEFREAVCCWMTTCMPNPAWFPKHLLLGELSKTGCKNEFRHYFLRSPAVLDCKDGRKKAIWLYDRIGKLIENFNIPKFDPNTKDKASLIKITPSKSRISPLGERAIPFYYNTEIRSFWSYEKRMRCHEKDIYSYFLPSPEIPKYTEAPFGFDIEKLPFYRIEHLINQDYSEAIKTIVALRATHNLAFSILPIPIYDSPIISDVPITIMGSVRESSGAGIPGANIQIKGTTKGTITDFNGNFKIIAKIGESIMCILVGFKSIEKIVDSEKIDFVLVEDGTGGRGILIASDSSNSKKALPKKAKLVVKNPEFTDGQAEIEMSATRAKRVPPTPFEMLMKLFPGIEHGAGVPQGGTFIIVYQSDKSGKSGPIVADFYLPYYLDMNIRKVANEYVGSAKLDRLIQV